jgi:hypothetical protein
MCRSQAVAVAWEIYRPQRGAFALLFIVLLLCAGFRWLAPSAGTKDGWFPDCCVLLLGLSLAASFVLFKFTESDRRERFTGFPSRLFTLPVRTIWLLTWPMLYGAAMVVLIYLAWAGLVLRPAHPGHFPLVFPSLYLATGLVCFQAIVWALAAHPILRLIVLGIWGAALTTSWLSFSPLMGHAQVGLGLAEMLHVSVRTAQSGLLVVTSVVSYGIACWSVSRQRHGARFKFVWPRLAFGSIASRFCTETKPFASPQAAQFWFEWRRNGMILPLIVTLLLLVITAPFFALRPFVGRAGGETTFITVAWILVLPLALAFIIGQGFGKTNFWGQGLGKELGVPQFLAVRPLTAADWIAVKLKVAALSALLTWSPVVLLVFAWLLTCCEVGAASAFIVTLPPSLWIGAFGTPLSLFLVLLVLLTWRLLVTNIYLGVLGSRLLLNAAFCVVFLIMFSPIPLIGWAEAHKDKPPNLEPVLVWLQWILGFLVALKFGLALRFLIKGKQRGLLSINGALAYLCVWIWGTELLLLCVLFAPVSDVAARVLGLLALLLLPLARIALGPLAFSRSRVR